MHQLQYVQNVATHLFGGLTWHDHIIPVMNDKIHWLPIGKKSEKWACSHTSVSMDYHHHISTRCACLWHQSLPEADRHYAAILSFHDEKLLSTENVELDI